LIFIPKQVVSVSQLSSTLKMRVSTLSSTPLLLIAILLLAAVLRLNHITQPFTDYIDWRQVSTAMMADNFYTRSWNIFYPEVSWDGPGPSYQGREFQTVSYLAALLYLVVGHQDWVGRIVAVIFGLWGIFALYQLVRRVWDEKYALASAAVMALIPGSIFVERSFIPDPAMVSLVVTSFWLLVVYFQTDRLFYLVLASLIGTWGLLTKVTGLIIGLPILYTMIIIYRQRGVFNLKRLALLAPAAILILIPVVVYYAWARHLSLTYPPYHFAGEGNWLWDSGLQQWWEQNYFLSALYWNFESWLWTKPVIILVTLGIILPPPYLSPESGSDQQLSTTSGKVPWLFHWWILGGLIYYLIGAQELVINAWNFHLLNPAAAALAARALIARALLARRWGRSPALGVTVAVILLVILGIGQKQLRRMYNPPWDSKENYKLGLALSQVSRRDDLVVTIPSGTTEPVAIYYSDRRGWSFPPHWPEVGWWGDTLPDDQEAIRLFEELRAQGADWLGIAGSRKSKLWNENPEFMQYIERTCELREESSGWLIYHLPETQEGPQLSGQK
jgi:hypothetical protein